MSGKFLLVDFASCPGQKIFVTQMLTRYMFAVANLLVTVLIG